MEICQEELGYSQYFHQSKKEKKNLRCSSKPKITFSLFQDPYAMKFMKDIKQTRTSWFAKSGGIMVIQTENKKL